MDDGPDQDPMVSSSRAIIVRPRSLTVPLNWIFLPGSSRTMLRSSRTISALKTADFWSVFWNDFWTGSSRTILDRPGTISVWQNPESKGFWQINYRPYRALISVVGFGDLLGYLSSLYVVDNFRYRQIGNAVAVPVARVLGYTLGLAWMKQSGDGHLMTLPPKFAFSDTVEQPSSSSSGIQQ
ncbi:DNA (cytosine-5)-methyltransferase CMT2 [Dendrobium catenatum]|uniref:DNA (Cytosine-5)-methyltransferase CMT2 n=1 Tax=Dendrobium catenatum TaxID=906689 RepID=A0A2I0X1U4_9ASPA|nr:DNA (cytosine-5)-methyltransferase CMT2 [Dendrobium catenatum]